jgi:hypothetical protein
MNGAAKSFLLAPPRLFQQLRNEMRNPHPSEPLAQNTPEWFDEYYRRLDVLRSRYPTMRAAELHHRALPPVANEAPAAPSKPAESKERTMAQRIWPDLK